MEARILKCPKCKPHEYQDKTYGPKMRVHSACMIGKSPGWRCTVCKNEKAG